MLNVEVLLNLIIDSLILFFCFISFLIAINIVKKFDINSNSNLQYKLILNSYLASTIVKISFIFKIVLFFYFIFTIDKLSDVLIGAMCGSGVITANSYGVWLLLIKILNIYLFGFWLVLNNLDLKTIDFKYSKRKFFLFLFLFLFLLIEVFLEYFYFSNIDVNKIVSCCGTLFNPYKTSNISYLLQIPNNILIPIFYILFLSMLFLKNKPILLAIVNIIFLFISILSIINFFSPYIYELPTHRCPFCFLQKDYYYIGYFIYIFLFLGTFFSLSDAFIKLVIKKRYTHFILSILFNLFFIAILSFFVINYYIKNGVFL